PDRVKPSYPKLASEISAQLSRVLSTFKAPDRPEKEEKEGQEARILFPDQAPIWSELSLNKALVPNLINFGKDGVKETLRLLTSANNPAHTSIAEMLVYKGLNGK